MMRGVKKSKAPECQAERLDPSLLLKSHKGEKGESVGHKGSAKASQLRYIPKASGERH